MPLLEEKACDFTSVCEDSSCRKVQQFLKIVVFKKNRGLIIFKLLMSFGFLSGSVFLAVPGGRASASELVRGWRT